MNFDISGAKIFFRIPTHLPLIGDIVVSETVVVSWLVMLIITGLCIFLTRDLKVEHIGKRQALAELIVESAENLVRNNTGGNKFDYLIPFVGALFHECDFEPDQPRRTQKSDGRFVGRSSLGCNRFHDDYAE